MQRLIASLTLTWALTVTGPAVAQPEHPWLDAAIVELRSTEDISTNDVGYAFYEYVTTRAPLEYSDHDIVKIGALLSDKSSTARYWSAASLGYIGPHAMIVGPQLQAALQRDTCSLPRRAMRSPTTVGAIMGAMRKIGLEPHRVSCPPQAVKPPLDTSAR